MSGHKGMRGHPISEETKKKIGAANKGKPSWMKGLHQSQETLEKKRVAMLGHTVSAETREKISRSCKGKKLSAIARENISKGHIGIERNGEWRENIRRSKLGEQNGAWKGGVTDLNTSIRECAYMKEWRAAVFARDNRSDHFSGIYSRDIEAHHIIPLSVLIEQNNIKTIEDALACPALWDLNNGITMSRENHVAYHEMWGRT